MKGNTPEITPESVYLSRRRFLKTGAAGAGALLLAACDRPGSKPADQSPPVDKPDGPELDKRGQKDRLTPFDAITNYNNFYEFTTDKEDVAQLAVGFKTEPWTVQIGGLVNNPKTYDVDDLVQAFGEEERVYRMRCVEAWSMIIPWLGFPLKNVIKAADPQAKARYVRFTAIFDLEQLPGQSSPAYEWPYVEGLRLDEAMNNLTLLSTGLYGKPLLPQCGAPIRLVVPWKYGYKSIKSIVRIDLVRNMPQSLWMQAAPDQYGFFANVNPDVSHPRWSQSSERRIGEFRRRPTVAFNGYGDEVNGIYKGMDLRRFR